MGDLIGFLLTGLYCAYLAGSQQAMREERLRTIPEIPLRGTPGFTPKPYSVLAENQHD